MSDWTEEHWDTMNLFGKVMFVLFWVVAIPVFWGIWFFGIYKLLD
jgi:hypothetical protein